MNIRAPLVGGGFVDLFYNEHSGTIAYALIQNQRIFGVDNTGGWHLHPFDDPARHDPLPAPMSFAEFIAQLQKFPHTPLCKGGKGGIFEFERRDITHFDAMKELFQHHNFDAVMNLAARAGVRASVENPWVYVETNVKGTLNLLELCSLRSPVRG